MIEIMTHTENSESVSDVNAMSLVNYSFVFFFFFDRESGGIYSALG